MYKKKIPLRHIPAFHSMADGAAVLSKCLISTKCCFTFASGCPLWLLTEDVSQFSHYSGIAAR